MGTAAPKAVIALTVTITLEAVVSSRGALLVAGPSIPIGSALLAGIPNVVTSGHIAVARARAVLLAGTASTAGGQYTTRTDGAAVC